jgi:Txe/YoeB family toxin of Txe-Axe toxin-antitoxin module
MVLKSSDYRAFHRYGSRKRRSKLAKLIIDKKRNPFRGNQRTEKNDQLSTGRKNQKRYDVQIGGTLFSDAVR